jgi:anaerobic ribonucleoside-triphosphate reductase activating protein
MKMRMYSEEQRSDVLSPKGLYRYILWAQGCERNCKGCMTKDSRPIDGGYERDMAELAADILKVKDIEGLTISGGEPFLQSTAIVELIKTIRITQDLNVTIYTGNSYEDLRKSNSESTLELLSLIDVLIDGEYVAELDDGMSLRGSSNQRAIRLSDRYSEELIKNAYGSETRRAVIRADSDGITLIGVPNNTQRQVFEVAKLTRQKSKES